MAPWRKVFTSGMIAWPGTETKSALLRALRLFGLFCGPTRFDAFAEVFKRLGFALTDEFFHERLACGLFVSDFLIDLLFVIEVVRERSVNLAGREIERVNYVVNG